MNYDHIAVDSSVTACDISKLKLEDHSVNIAILCLAMWGSNCREYLVEAYRILEEGGKLLIYEPSKRWTNEDGSCRLENWLVESGFKVSRVCSDKFVGYECVK
jgi:ubiquinone/menaquinone biosynthesis C-methylase UbiE